MANIDKLKKFSVREYKIKDFKKIQKLFELSFYRELSYENWHWECIQNPTGKSIVFLMFDDDKLIGHYNCSPILLNFRGNTIPAAISIISMTHPDYRRLGINPYLAKLTFQKLKEIGIEMVYAFPNREATQRIFFQKLNFVKLNKVNYIYKEISGYESKLNNLNKSHYSIVQIEKFDDEIDNFFENIKDYPKIFRVISKEILNWRFSKNSNKEYFKFLIKDSKNKEILAFFVLKIFINEQEELFLDLVDYFINNNNLKQKYEIFLLIQEFSINYFKNKCSKIMMWLPDNKIVKNLIADMNYEHHYPPTNLYYQILKEASYSDYYNKIENWHLTMAHSDIF